MTNEHSLRPQLSLCPVCCEHGVSNQAWCEWCDEALEFGTSEYDVIAADFALPCVHLVSAAS